jgi:periplasmic protein TonB
MFDTLVESTSGKKSHRAGKFATWITAFYVLALTAGAVWSIMRFNASLAETADAATLLAPPPPPPPPPPAAEVVVVQKTVEVATAFVPPKEPPKEIPKAVDVKPKPVQAAAVVSQGVPGGTGVPGGVPGGVPAGTGDSEPPPPPPPPPKPSATPTPTPPPKPSTQRVSGGVLQGNALRKVQPPYPAIAKAARAQGAVQVAVTISEEGRVISAEAVSGHPLLKEAAVAAARQWTFKPTELSGTPVKVQGILTFNFTLQ